MAGLNASQLSAIEEPTLRALAEKGVMRACRKGTVVIAEGDAGDTLYIIAAGEVQIHVTDDERHQMVLGMRGPGDWVGEMALDGGVRSASVVCKTDCTFSMVTRKTLQETIRADPDLAITMIIKLIARARLATDLVKDLALRTVYQRTTRLLLGLAQEQFDGTLALSEPLSQAEMARRVGCSRDMVNQIFRALAMGGYVEVRHGRICLPLKKLPLAF